MKEYLFSYYFKGKKWSTSVFAETEAEAKLKMLAQAQADYDGVLAMRIPAPRFALKLVRCWDWFKLKGKNH